MSTGEGEDPRNGQARRDGDARRVERIGVGGGDDSVSRIQLAARWAEAYGGDNDSLRSVLHRFRAAYDYLDAVIHGVEPAELDSEADEARPSGPTTGYSSMPPAEPSPAWREPAPEPQAQPTPPPSWGQPQPPEPVPPPPWAPPTQPEPGSPPSEPRPWG